MSASFENDHDFHDVVPKPTPRRGMRLVELLVVVSIIGILVGLLLPVRRSSREAGRRAQCANSLKQIALALQNYEQDYKSLPPAHTVDPGGRPLHSWRTLILPYLDEEPLFRTIDLARPWNDPANAKARGTKLHVFRCPNATGPDNTTTYLAVAGPNGCLMPGRGRPLSEITDAHGSTFMVIEAGEENAVPWMAPRDADESLVMSLGPATKLHHPGGTHASLVDGSVRFLKADVPLMVRRAMMSIAGNDDDVTPSW